MYLFNYYKKLFHIKDITNIKKVENFNLIQYLCIISNCLSLSFYILIRLVQNENSRIKKDNFYYTKNRLFVQKGVFLYITSLVVNPTLKRFILGCERLIGIK